MTRFFAVLILVMLFAVGQISTGGWISPAYAGGGSGGDDSTDAGETDADAGAAETDTDGQDDSDDMEEAKAVTGVPYCEYPLAWIFPPTYVLFCYDYEFPASWDFSG